MKKPGVRSQALRAAVGGLLTSSLTDAELKKFAQDLDLEFLEDLREMLVSLPLRSDSSMEDVQGKDSTTGLAKEIFEKAKVKRISKSQIVSYMREIDRSAANSLDATGATLMGLIDGFVVRTGLSGAERLASRLSGRLEQDPFLVGISDRK